MLGTKKIKELEKQLEFYKGKVDELTKELTEVKSSVCQYKRLFSQLFDRTQLINTVGYGVYKDLTDGKVLLHIDYDDNYTYVYKIDLVETKYIGVLGGLNEQTNE